MNRPGTFDIREMDLMEKGTDRLFNGCESNSLWISLSKGLKTSHNQRRRKNGNDTEHGIGGRFGTTLSIQEFSNTQEIHLRP